MKSNHRKIPTGNEPDTIEALEFLLVRTLHKEGWTPDAITGFVVAHRSAGALRPHCPKWLRASTGFLLSHGKGIEHHSVEKAASDVADHLKHTTLEARRVPGPFNSADNGNSSAGNSAESEAETRWRPDPSFRG